MPTTAEVVTWGKESLRVIVAGALVTACLRPYINEETELPPASPTPVSRWIDDPPDYKLNPNEPTPFSDLDPSTSSLDTKLESTPLPTPEQSHELVNSYRGKPFNQRCTVEIDEKGSPNFLCLEDWAEAPLPGGCPVELGGKFKNFLGGTSCNATALAFVLNELVPPKVIMQSIDQPGVTPLDIVWRIYPNLPNGQALRMTCSGAGIEKVGPVIEFFGLGYERVIVSEFNIVDIVKSLKPNQRLMVSIIGTRWSYDGPIYSFMDPAFSLKQGKFQHYSIASGTTILPSGRETATFSDSFYYLNPRAWDVSPLLNPNNYGTGPGKIDTNKVVFELSSHIRADPTRIHGKAFDYVGGVIITAPDSWEGFQPYYFPPVPMPTPRPELPSLDETRIFSSPVELPPDFAVLEPPVLIGPDRYRVKIQASGRESIYYYSGTPDQLPLFDQVVWFRWQDLYLPLLNQQDFRWAGLPMPGFTDPMTGEPVKLGRQTCGQAITASLVSITDEISPEPEVTPDQIHQTYFSDRKLLGTVITDHVPIWEQAGYTVDQILSIPAIDESIDNNKVVVVQGFFNFHWWDESDRLVEHFVLVLDKDTNNQLVIWDPIWGFGVTKIKDLDLGRPHAMYALTFPEP